MRAAVLAFVAAAGCDNPQVADGGDYELTIPAHFPDPLIPDDAPITQARVELGHLLFYDVRLSAGSNLSCAGCHRQAFAFADDGALSRGTDGSLGVLNTPSLINIAYVQPLTWSHQGLGRIEDQLELPMFGTSPLEMGIMGNETAILATLAEDARLHDLYIDAFDGSQWTFDNIQIALASFLRTLIAGDSAFDRHLLGDTQALSASARRGSELFFSSRLGCGGCHGGFALSQAVRSSESGGQPPDPYHNIGLYNLEGGRYPSTAPGLTASTGADSDRGRFRVPSLRNVARTAPYMHDGSVASLAEVIAIYEAGGRVIEGGAHAGDGRANPWRSDLLQSFVLEDEERDDVIAFLHALTDASVFTDERWADPW